MLYGIVTVDATKLIVITDKINSISGKNCTTKLATLFPLLPRATEVHIDIIEMCGINIAQYEATFHITFLIPRK